MGYSAFTRKRAVPGVLAPGKRVYAIGDIHGRLDLFARIIAAIEADTASRPQAEVTIIIIGDFIDRGSRSADMIRLLRKCDLFARMIILKGNHEATMVDALKGVYDAMSVWMEFGGDATLESYGVARASIEEGNPRELVRAARRKVPISDVEWLDSLPVYYREDGYFFVHAGVRPGVPLRLQSVDDMLWIRGHFTSSDVMHEAVIVHGHSVEPAGVALLDNRIGLDTGAGHGGMLSAVVLEEDQRWIIDSETVVARSAGATLAL